MAYARNVSVTYNTVDVLAAAMKAFAVNGAIIKDRIEEYEGNVAVAFKEANRTLVMQYLSSGETLDTTGVEEAVSLLSSSVTMDILNNKPTNDFVRKMVTIISNPTVSSNDIGILLYFPSTLASRKKMEDLKEAMFDFYGSEYLGKEGDKLNLTLTALTIRPIQAIGCFAIFGHDGNGNIVEFLTPKEDLANAFKINVPTAIKAKVKKIGLNPYRNNLKTTYINYVRIV